MSIYYENIEEQFKPPVTTAANCDLGIDEPLPVSAAPDPGRHCPALFLCCLRNRACLCTVIGPRAIQSIASDGRTSSRRQSAPAQDLGDEHATLLAADA